MSKSLINANRGVGEGDAGLGASNYITPVRTALEMYVKMGKAEKVIIAGLIVLGLLGISAGKLVIIIMRAGMLI